MFGRLRYASSFPHQSHGDSMTVLIWNATDFRNQCYKINGVVDHSNFGIDRQNYVIPISNLPHRSVKESKDETFCSGLNFEFRFLCRVQFYRFFDPSKIILIQNEYSVLCIFNLRHFPKSSPVENFRS